MLSHACRLTLPACASDALASFQVHLPYNLAPWPNTFLGNHIFAIFPTSFTCNGFLETGSVEVFPGGDHTLSHNVSLIPFPHTTVRVHTQYSGTSE